MRLAPYRVVPGLMSDVGYQTSDFERTAVLPLARQNPEWPLSNRRKNRYLAIPAPTPTRFTRATNLGSALIGSKKLSASDSLE